MHISFNSPEGFHPYHPYIIFRLKETKANNGQRSAIETFWTIERWNTVHKVISPSWKLPIKAVSLYKFHTYTCIHTYTCAYTHTHILTYTHAYTHAPMHTHIHTRIHTYTHAYTHTHIHTCIYTHTYTHTHMHTHIHTYTHTHMRAHLYTPICTLHNYTNTSAHTQHTGVFIHLFSQYMSSQRLHHIRLLWHMKCV